MNAKQKKDIEKILDHFGEESQILKCVGELNECATELMKIHFKQRANAQFVQEEIADAIIMLEQVRLIFDTESIDAFIEYKLKRTLDRIKNEAK